MQLFKQRSSVDFSLPLQFCSQVRRWENWREVMSSDTCVDRVLLDSTVEGGVV